MLQQSFLFLEQPAPFVLFLNHLSMSFSDSRSDTESSSSMSFHAFYLPTYYSLTSIAQSIFSIFVMSSTVFSDQVARTASISVTEASNTGLYLVKRNCLFGHAIAVFLGRREELSHASAKGAYGSRIAQFHRDAHQRWELQRFPSHCMTGLVSLYGRAIRLFPNTWAFNAISFLYK